MFEIDIIERTNKDDEVGGEVVYAESREEYVSRV